MKQKRKKENNLGFSQDTYYLVNQYRIIKFLERASHRIKNSYDFDLDEFIEKEFPTNRELKDIFIDFIYYSESEEGYKVEYLKSKQLLHLGSLYRVCQKRGILEDSIAKYVYEVSNSASKIDRKVVNSYAAHLRYYINHPEIHKEYKLK